MLVALSDVYDEAELAEIVERKATEASIAAILKDMPENRHNPELIVTNPNKTCNECGDLISEARQRIVLTISKHCNFCADCQAFNDKLSKADA